MTKRIELYDTTLRDGAQGEQISFSVEDKLNILKRFDELGIDFVEGGIPASNQKDRAFFEQAKMLSLRHTVLAAFGATRRAGLAAADDDNLRQLARIDAGVLTVFGKAWDFQVREVLKASLEENLAMIYDTVAYLKEGGRRVFFDAEHFFDGYKENPDYALQAIRAACRAGAERIILCDTNGGSFPDEISRVIGAVAQGCDVPLGVHCHNDTGCAVASSMLAVQAGAEQVQGTFLGFGERCGNANLAVLIGNLQLKYGMELISRDQLGRLTQTAKFISEICNQPLDHAMPYVGKSAFAHKGGMHVDGVCKNRRSFEHVNPQEVGNRRNLLISEFSGKTAAGRLIGQLGDLPVDDKAARAFISLLKKKEFEGYQFESAGASLKLLALKHFEKFEPFFELVHYKIIGENPALHPQRTAAAVVRVRVGEKEEINAAEGQGPIHALDRALRKALEVFYPQLAGVRLIDYKVRVMEPNEATAAKVRVLIESKDAESSWITVGVSNDIIKASFQALCDSIEYKLLKAKVHSL